MKKAQMFLLIFLGFFANLTFASNKEVINVDIFIGIMDFPNEDVFANESVDNAIKGKLVGACRTGQLFCQMNYDDTYNNPHFSRFTKEFSGKIYSVTIYNSAFANDFELSLTEFREDQKNHSELVRAQFINSLQTSDKVIYIGHSRFGGGPDFNLPIYFEGTSEINKNYYQSRHEGLNDLISGLSSRNQRSPLQLGIYSCDSASHFMGQLNQFKNKAQITVQTKALKVEEAVNLALRNLN